MNLLLMIALLPAALLTIYIYKKDRVEREPVRMIVRLLALGAFACLPASVLEMAISRVLSAMPRHQSSTSCSAPPSSRMYSG